MNKKTTASMVLAGGLSICSVSALAVDVAGLSGFKGADDISEAVGLPVGPFTAYPVLNLSFTHDDNILRQPDNEESSFVTVISPQVVLESNYRANNYLIAYLADIGRYDSSSQDNYEDHQLLAKAGLSFSSRTSLDLQFEYNEGHEGRGSTDRTILEHPDEWHSTGFGGVFAYGSRDAIGRIELEASHVDREYDNNRVVTIGADHERDIYGATFFYRVRPKTHLLFQAQRTEFDYDLSTSTLDSDEDHYFVGVKWDATAKTSGTAKLGYLKKDFDDGSRDDVSGSSWDIGVQWRPRSYSTFDFNTSRNTKESTGVGDTIIIKAIGAVWKHAWNSRFSTTAGAALSNAEYQNFQREDDYQKFSLGANYKMRRWLKFGAGYSYHDNDSDDPTQDYDRNIFMFTVGLTI